MVVRKGLIDFPENSRETAAAGVTASVAICSIEKVSAVKRLAARRIRNLRSSAIGEHPKAKLKRDRNADRLSAAGSNQVLPSINSSLK
jgi:hypothetical protein